MSDTSFDGISVSFEPDIYAFSKGYVRLGVLWEDLSSANPEITRGGLGPRFRVDCVKPHFPTRALGYGRKKLLRPSQTA